MDTDQIAQIEALLFGDPYSWAVKSGRIASGQSLQMSKVFSVTRRDVIEYLRSQPLPGFDLRQASYRGISDGPKIHNTSDNYAIGWQERGIFLEEFSTPSEAAAREYWVEFLANSLGLAA